MKRQHARPVLYLTRAGVRVLSAEENEFCVFYDHAFDEEGRQEGLK